jgi:chemotaxis protein CheX
MSQTSHEEPYTVELQETVTELLHSVMDSVRQVIPVSAVVQSATFLKDSVVQNEIGVLVGFTGDLYGRILMQGDAKTFSSLGETMYGMPLEGDILHSFIGELANMIAGNTSTILYDKARMIDITPPTVMVGKLQLYGFESGISVPVEFEKIGNLNIILMLQNEGGI